MRVRVFPAVSRSSVAVALVVASAWLLLPGRAMAQGTVVDLLADGWQRYSEELDFEGAAAAYLAVTEHSAATDEQLLEAFEYLAACRFALGDQDGARQALTSLLQINHEQRLSDPSHSPDFLQLLEDLRAEVSAASDQPLSGQAVDVEAPPTSPQPGEGPVGGGTEPPPRPRRPVYRTWWFWTILGVVVAGAVTTGAVLGTREDEEPPQGGLDPGVVQLPCVVRF